MRIHAGPVEKLTEHDDRPVAFELHLFCNLIRADNQLTDQLKKGGDQELIGALKSTYNYPGVDSSDEQRQVFAKRYQGKFVN